MTRPMRALSINQAQRCEEAREKVCRCRCGGEFHGRKRGDILDLPVTDPHSPTRTCHRCKGVGRLKYLGTDIGKCGTCQGTGRLLSPDAQRKVNKRFAETGR